MIVDMARRAFNPRLRRARAATKDLETLDGALTAVVGGILQESNRTAFTIVGVATSKIVAAGVVAGTFSGIAAFGAASTGTAIATLSGAAATTATLYWVGSSVGMGVAAGSVMVTGGALAAGIPIALLVRRRIFGRRRTTADLGSQEQAALYAALCLAAPVRIMKAKASPLLPVEMRIFAQTGLAPLIAALNENYINVPRIDGENRCAARNGSLAYWPRRRLTRAVRRLDRIAMIWAKA
ncbi:hypothetical protein SAMN04488004_103234 [Loktanella salsilacus]|uniref:Uncharacterized protein n=1 Tax=Loktanella salsilacus TaxID=195913 RepID=A0A1I4D6Y1_9RHOB|nr:hypothetical protein [Loktanella salsilacus]SFK88589.1 hypothetical protein SAMN04488004_103234 [Loktanella salsilacus]